LPHPIDTLEFITSELDVKAKTDQEVFQESLDAFNARQAEMCARAGFVIGKKGQIGKGQSKPTAGRMKLRHRA